MTEPKPILLKKFPPQLWEEAKQAANKRGESVAEWLARTCEKQVDLEKHDGVIEPGKPITPGPITVQDNPPVPGSLEQMRVMGEFMTAMTTAGIDIPETQRSLAKRLLGLHLRAAVPVKRKKPAVATLEHQPVPERLSAPVTKAKRIAAE